MEKAFGPFIETWLPLTPTRTASVQNLIRSRSRPMRKKRSRSRSRTLFFYKRTRSSSLVLFLNKTPNKVKITLKRVDLYVCYN